MSPGDDDRWSTRPSENGDDRAGAASQSDRTDVGTLGEEAAKLLGALSQWAQERHDGAQDHAQGNASTGSGARAGREETGSRRADRSSDREPHEGLADRVVDAVRQVDDHLAGDATECRWCPVCRVVHAVRQTSPEVREHLAAAAGSLLEAASGLLATHVPPNRRSSGSGDGRSAGRGGRVEHIDLGGADEDWTSAAEAGSPPGRPGDAG